MISRALILFIVSLGTSLFASNWEPGEQEHMTKAAQTQNEPRAPMRAEAKIRVQRSEVKPFDQTAIPALMEVHITEIFTGDMNGNSTVRALQVVRPDKSAGMVSMQRFSGQIGRRRGTFVLQGSEVIENGRIRATWSVVHGSGTGGLSRLRGEGGFEGEFGKGSAGWLSYWFE
jgi:hypothetical protein